MHARSLNLNLQDEQTKKTALMNAMHNDRLGLVKVFVDTELQDNEGGDMFGLARSNAEYLESQREQLEKQLKDFNVFA